MSVFPPRRRCVSSASSCLMKFHLFACLDFFCPVLLCVVRKKRGEGPGGSRERGGVKDKLYAFRLAADWSARVKERRANATNRRGFTSYSVQDLSDAIGLFALERRTRAGITGNQWRATNFTSRSSVTSRSINTPYNSLKYCQHSERHGNFKTSVKKVRQTYAL